MAETNKNTIFQRLGKTLANSWDLNTNSSRNINTYDFGKQDDILYKGTDPVEYERNLAQLKQQNLLAMQWVKAGVNVGNDSLMGYTQTQLMYRDADLMDGWPEISSALDILSEEASVMGKNNKIINVYSSSDRVKSILEDLFVNRLNIHVMLPMICRTVAKYGNNFMLLNIDEKNGIKGWKQLPTYEIVRLENGITNPYMVNTALISGDVNPDEVNFAWINKEQSLTYKSWQIAHFRLLTNSLYLPYGISYLNGARRHWRMLSMMEDSMLLYRLERSIERRIFNVYVGNVDPTDVPAYVQQVANNFKRSSVIDPQTGQIDLRKNFLDVSVDYFIPTRTEGGGSNPIQSLPAAQNITSMDDINYMQNKVLSALHIPKTFLNFQEPQGKGVNLSLMDIRFARTVMRVQQSLLMELNKVAMIHLFLLGLTDELTNFSITLNNPSNQIELLELEALQKKINVAKDAVSIQGDHLPVMSWKQAQKEILGKSENEIAELLNEIRLERALFVELGKTEQIITKTGVFDPIDRIFGDPNAKYTSEDGEGITPGGGSSGVSFGSDLGDLGEPGGGEGGEIGGMEGETDLANASTVDEGGISMENNYTNKPLIKNITGDNNLINEYIDYINKNEILEKKSRIERVKLYDKGFVINEEMNEISKQLEEMLETDKKPTL